MTEKNSQECVQLAIIHSACICYLSYLNLVLWDAILSSLEIIFLPSFFFFLMHVYISLLASRSAFPVQANPKHLQEEQLTNNGRQQTEWSFSTDLFGLLLPHFSKTPPCNMFFIHLLYCILWTVCRRNRLLHMPAHRVTRWAVVLDWEA